MTEVGVLFAFVKNRVEIHGAGTYPLGGGDAQEAQQKQEQLHNNK